jgi:hypothetical protein
VPQDLGTEIRRRPRPVDGERQLSGFRPADIRGGEPAGPGLAPAPPEQCDAEGVELAAFPLGAFRAGRGSRGTGRRPRSHFREGRAAVEAELATAPADIAGSFRVLPIAGDGGHLGDQAGLAGAASPQTNTVTGSSARASPRSSSNNASSPARPTNRGVYPEAAHIHSRPANDPMRQPSTSSTAVTTPGRRPPTDPSQRGTLLG